MEILNESWTLSGIGIGLLILGIILGVFLILLIYDLITGEFDDKIVAAILVMIILASSVGGCIFGVFKTKIPTYQVYLSDMSLQEFETEYEPIDIDGLVITSKRKD